MYWFGIVITFGAGLLGIAIIRRLISKFVPKAKDSYFDILLICLLIFGVTLTTFQHIISKHKYEKIQLRTEKLEYQDIAKYNASGNVSGSWNGIRMVRTPIDDWSNNFLTRQDGHLIWSCKYGAMDACKEVISKLPTYPFAYYFLALCEKEKGDSNWRKNAEEALFILKKTTSLENHNKDHDEILRDVKALLTK